MPRLSLRFAGLVAGLAVAITATAFASPAAAQSGHRRWPHETRAERREFRSHRYYGGQLRDGGRGDGIYPPAYDAARRYYGGRGDNRWRWTEPGGRPFNYGAPYTAPYGFFGWYGY